MLYPKRIQICRYEHKIIKGKKEGCYLYLMLICLLLEYYVNF